MNTKKNTNRRAAAPPKPSHIRKEEEEYDAPAVAEEEAVEEEEETTMDENQEKMMKLLEKSVSAIEAIKAENGLLRKEIDGLKAKDDYPQTVDAPTGGTAKESDSDHDATEDEVGNEVAEESAVEPMGEYTDTGDAFTGKAVKELMKRVEMLEKGIEERDEVIGTFAQKTQEGFTHIASKMSRPSNAFIGKSDGGLRGLINKAVEIDRAACGSHSMLAADSDVFGFKSARGDLNARKTTARWITKTFGGGMN